MKQIVYIADIEQDIDDIIAAEYLFRHGSLKAVVIDPKPKSAEGYSRIKAMQDMGITISRKIVPCDGIFVGGSFTEVARYLTMNKVECLVANGGFVGANIVKPEHQLPKFKGKTEVRTYNFNLDVESVDKVLKSKHINRIYLVGKNVCHSEQNTINGIWKSEEWLSKYNLRKDKRLHDLLMVSEGLKLIEGRDSDILDYDLVDVYNKGLKGKYTEWGSTPGYQLVAATNWR